MQIMAYLLIPHSRVKQPDVSCRLHQSSSALSLRMVHFLTSESDELLQIMKARMQEKDK